MSNGQKQNKSFGKSWLDANALEDSINHAAALGNIRAETDTLNAGDSTHVDTALKGIYGPVSKYVSQDSLYSDYSNVYASLNTLSGRNMTGFDPIDYATKNKLGSKYQIELAVRGGNYGHFPMYSTSRVYGKGKEIPGFSKWKKKGRPKIEDYFYDLAFQQNLKTMVDLGSSSQGKRARAPGTKQQLSKLKGITGDSYSGYMEDIVKSSIIKAEEWANKYSLDTKTMMGEAILAIDNKKINNEVSSTLLDLNKVLERKASFEKTKANLENLTPSDTSEVSYKILNDEASRLKEFEERILFNIDDSGAMTPALNESLLNISTVKKKIKKTRGSQMSIWH